MLTPVLFLVLFQFNAFFSGALQTRPGDNEPSGGGLVWQQDRRLTWDDFESEADTREPLHAMTSTNIEVQAKCYGNLMRFDVKCVFVTKDSWSKNKVSAKLLAHEQMHFDLTEVHARLLRQKLSSSPGLCGGDKAFFSKVVDQYFAAWKSEQDLYDAETNHGLNQEKQQTWDEQIARRLNNLQPFTYALAK